MIGAFIKAVIGLSIILGGWLVVQTAWRYVTGAAPEEDALAGRLGCQGCGCLSRCENKEKLKDEFEIH